jgi:formylglycine-generating enzyme required for sulfatase activity
MKLFVVLAVYGAFALSATAQKKPKAPPPKPKAPVSSWAKVSPEQQAAAKKLGVPVGFENDVGMRFVLIPAGTFKMGSRDSAAVVAKKCNMNNAQAGWFWDEHPQHEVVIEKAFYMAIHEMSEGVYRKLYPPPPPPKPKKGAKPKPPPKPVDPTLPRGGISCSKAEEICRKLSGMDKRKYGVPTEAQWEYASRAGGTTPFCFGETISTDQANYNGNYTYAKGKKGVYRAKAVPVGSLPPSKWGLYEMHGNLAEVTSTPHRDYSVPIDPKKKNRNSCVIRGGSWRSYPGALRSAFRLGSSKGHGAGHIGFRAVCALPEKEKPKDKKKKK